MGDGVRAIESKKLPSLQYYRSIDHALDVFCSYFGPTMRVLRRLDAEESRQQFLEALEGVFKRYNKATDGTAVVENHYLQTIATRA